MITRSHLCSVTPTAWLANVPTFNCVYSGVGVVVGGVRIAGLFLYPLEARAKPDESFVFAESPILLKIGNFQLATPPFSRFSEGNPGCCGEGKSTLAFSSLSAFFAFS